MFFPFDHNDYMSAFKERMKWAMQPMWKEKISIDVCEQYIVEVLQIYIGHSVEHRVESIQIKATLFITSCQSQSAIRNKTWTSKVPNFVNYLAQSCVGSSRRSYVNLIHLLP